MLIVSLVSISVLASATIPHHHHENTEIMCLCTEGMHSTDCGCESHGTESNCCQFAKDLTSPFSDGRKEHHCGCHNDIHHHLYAIIIFTLNIPTDETIAVSGTGRDTYSDHYLSVTVCDNTGLRAPPATYSYTV